MTPTEAATRLLILEQQISLPPADTEAIGLAINQLRTGASTLTFDDLCPSEPARICTCGGVWRYGYECARCGT